MSPTPSKSESPVHSSPSSPIFHYSPLPNLNESPLLLPRQRSTPHTRVQQQLIPPSEPTACNCECKEAIKALEIHINRRFDELFALLRQQSPHTQHTLSNHHTTPQSHNHTNDHVTPPANSSSNHLAEDSTHSPDGATSMGLTNDTLLQIRNLACSKENFAVRLVRETFQPHELVGRNVVGKRGKQSLDPVRIQSIKKLVTQFYPVPPMEIESVWRGCRKAIDSFLRKPRKNQNIDS